MRPIAHIHTEFPAKFGIPRQSGLAEGLRGRVTVVLTTHYLEEAEALSDRVGVLAHGRLKALGTARELIERTGAKNFEDAFVALASEGGDRVCG